MGFTTRSQFSHFPSVSELSICSPAPRKLAQCPIQRHEGHYSLAAAELGKLKGDSTGWEAPLKAGSCCVDQAVLSGVLRLRYFYHFMSHAICDIFHVGVGFWLLMGYPIPNPRNKATAWRASIQLMFCGPTVGIFTCLRAKRLECHLPTSIS